ncbi:hypothetical protein H2200_006870 [Cladophialophora chaetospira]|uniref:Uncharacterized protein n=1 Tax=Cladophialophora chaetospira TaxID=386627 RepID=A0AA38X9L4_9EURO|nr:hypothetical protein H2200_006870 [Cladophialophora chaetospira]
MSRTPTEPQLSAVTDHGKGPTLHPADISGPSANPDLQLLGMPREVRNEIYRNLLVKDGVVLVNRAHDYRSYRLSLDRPGLVIGPKNITNILRVNQQIKEECLDILYGENKFECHKARSFERGFVNSEGKSCNCAAEINPFCRGHKSFLGIGKSNAAKIKHVTFGLEELCEEGLTGMSYRSQDHPDHAIFLEILCTILPSLQKLTLKLRTKDSRVSTPRERMRKSTQVQRITALVGTAGRITKYHPVLRKAIWRHWSSSDLVDSDQIASDHDCWGTDHFYIDLVAEGARPLPRTNKTTKSALVEGVPLSDVVLDSQLIRRTGWVSSPLWSNVANFKLEPDNDATKSTPESSERDHTEVTTWPGVANYDPFSELGHEDQAALLERHKGRWIEGKFVEGRIVNGWFAEGRWNSNGFVEGRPGERWRETISQKEDGTKVRVMTLTPSTEGKWEKGHFTEGMCRAGGDFVEGRWE